VLAFFPEVAALNSTYVSLSKDHNKVTTLKFKVSLRSEAFALSTFPFDLVKRVSGHIRDLIDLGRRCVQQGGDLVSKEEATSRQTKLAASACIHVSCTRPGGCLSFSFIRTLTRSPDARDTFLTHSASLSAPFGMGQP